MILISIGSVSFIFAMISLGDYAMPSRIAFATLAAGAACFAAMLVEKSANVLAHAIINSGRNPKR